jgi:hypothetical protein
LEGLICPNLACPNKAADNPILSTDTVTDPSGPRPAAQVAPFTPATALPPLAIRSFLTYHQDQRYQRHSNHSHAHRKPEPAQCIVPHSQPRDLRPGC